MYCKICGAQIKETSHFCPKCGNNLEGNVGIGTMEKPAAQPKKWYILFIVLLLLVTGTVGVIVIKKNSQKKYLYLEKEKYIWGYIDSYNHGIKKYKYENVKDENGISSKGYDMDSGELVQESQYDLYGNLISRKEAIYEHGVKMYDSLCTYDTEGNLLNEKDYTAGKLEWEYEYEYDMSGNCLSLKRTLWYDGDEHTVIREYSYDSSGRRLSETGGLSIEPDFDYVYENTENGLSAKKYDTDGILWEELLYDDLGNVILDKKYNAYAEIISWYEYSYDEQGKQESEIVYNDAGERILETQYTYDRNGNVSKKETERADGYVEEKIEYYYEKFEVIKLPTE